VARQRVDELARAIRRLSVDLAGALSEIEVPAFVLDRRGNIRWLNAAALETFGDRRGEHYSVVVAPEAHQMVATQFTQKVVGTARTSSYEAPLVARQGRRVLAEIDSVRIEDHGHVIGVFGLIDFEHVVDEEAARTTGLTPRQLEVLRLLAGGRSTDQIAEQLRLSRETVRNHVRHILGALGAHSRLEAVARARAAGIL
jgi:PAS domain S-box-containing protein